jgi:AraC-like DNA-binding protein
MPTIPLVRVSNFLPFFTFLQRLGSPVERWLTEVNLSPFALEDPELLLSRHLGLAFIKKAARHEGLEHLGLLVGQKTPLSQLGNFGQLLCQCLTLNEALSTLQALAPLHNSGEQWWRQEEASYDRVWFCMRYVNTAGIDSSYASQFALTQIIDLIRWAAGQQWQPLAIALQTRQAQKIHYFLEEIPIHWGRGFTGVCFPQRLLSLPIQSPLTLTPEQIANNHKKLQGSSPCPTFAHSLQQALGPLLRGGYPDIHLGAAIAGVSVRTLQRRLQEEGLTYSHMVQTLRLERALELLKSPSLSSMDIALELGYSDAAHFSRAFKRWTGVSPQTFRRDRRPGSRGSKGVEDSPSIS